MKNLKKITFGLVTLGLLSTTSFAKQSDMEYQCKSENNPLACVGVNYEIAEQKEHTLRRGRSIKSERVLGNKIEKIYRDTFYESRKYCQ